MVWRIRPSAGCGHYPKEQRVQFRVDAFNIFNTPAYSTPSALSDNSSSGYITSARSLGAYTPDVRFFQLALKYDF